MDNSAMVNYSARCMLIGFSSNFPYRESAEKLPSNEEIFKLYNSQIHKAAIILICFNEELSFQSYIYRFTA